MKSEEEIRSAKARESELLALCAIEYARLIVSGDEESATNALLRFSKHEGAVKILSEVLK